MTACFATPSAKHGRGRREEGEAGERRRRRTTTSSLAWVVLAQLLGQDHHSRSFESLVVVVVVVVGEEEEGREAEKREEGEEERREDRDRGLGHCWLVVGRQVWERNPDPDVGRGHPEQAACRCSGAQGIAERSTRRHRQEPRGRTNCCPPFQMALG